MSAPTSTNWRKSHRSGNFGCVELRSRPSTLSIRDSKNPVPALDFPAQSLSRLVSYVRA